jgi:hypothetical protein
MELEYFATAQSFVGVAAAFLNGLIDARGSPVEFAKLERIPHLAGGKVWILRIASADVSGVEGLLE